MNARYAPRGNCSLRLVALHVKSFAGDYPVCMQNGAPSGAVGRSYLDYDNLADAEADGAFLLRQNIRLLPNLFDLGIHDYAQLVRQGVVDPSRINHFFCHYSSQKFGPVVAELLDKAGLGILPERWYSNLRWRGNTRAASIFVMLHDFLQDRRVEPGEQILCFIPESGRFTLGYVLLEVVGPRADAVVAAAEEVPAPHDPNSVADPRMRRLLMELAAIWHDYRSRVWRTPIMRKILTQRLTLPEFVRWMEQWIPQVREGSFRMQKAVLGLGERFLALRALIETHAGEEQFDFRILFDDYRRAGGTAPHVESLKRNPGGEALHAYLNARAEGQSPIGLLGAIYIIRGTGQRIVPAILPALREQLKLPLESVRFLHYHGQNDINHLRRWLQCVETVLAAQSDDALAHHIVVTSRATDELYLLQLNSVQVS